MGAVVEFRCSRWSEVLFDETVVSLVRLISDHRPLAVLVVSAPSEGAQVSSGLLRLGTQVLTHEKVARLEGGVARGP